MHIRQHNSELSGNTRQGQLSEVGSHYNPVVSLCIMVCIIFKCRNNIIVVSSTTHSRPSFWCIISSITEAGFETAYCIVLDTTPQQQAIIRKCILKRLFYILFGPWKESCDGKLSNMNYNNTYLVCEYLQCIHISRRISIPKLGIYLMSSAGVVVCFR